MSKRCRALYAYTKQHTNEISFAQGDIIEDVVEHEDGWWSGMVHGQLGVFPYTYVEPLQNNEITVRACYDYDAKSPNELSIRKGDVFIVNEKDTEGKWWHGVFTQPTLRKGWFPAQYVQEIDSSEALQAPEEPATTTTTTTTTTHQQYSQPMPPQPQGPKPVIQQPQQPRPPQPQSPKPFVPDHASFDDGQKTIEKDAAPPPMKPVKAEKAAKGVAGYIDLQVHGAQGLPDAKAAQVAIGVKEGDKGKLRKVFKTEPAKKSPNPFWMESFQVNIMDPEDSDLLVQVMDGKKALGDVLVPLRSTKRAPLEAFGGLDKSFPLPVGTLHLVISYRDINAPSKPKFFKKDESIVMSATAEGFDLSAAGKHWVQKFHDAGLEIASGDIPQQEPPPPPQNKPVVPQLQKPPPPQNKPIVPQLQPQPPKPAPVPSHQPPKPAPPMNKPAIPTHHPLPPVGSKPTPKPAPPPQMVKPPPMQPKLAPKPAPPQMKPAPLQPPMQPRPPQQSMPQVGGMARPPPMQHQPPAKPAPPPQRYGPAGGGTAPPNFNPSPRTTVTPLPVQGAARLPPTSFQKPPPPPAYEEDPYSSGQYNDTQGNDYNNYNNNYNDNNGYGNDQHYDNGGYDNNGYGNDQYYDNSGYDNSGYDNFEAPPPLPARDD